MEDKIFALKLAELFELEMTVMTIWVRNDCDDYFRISNKNQFHS